MSITPVKVAVLGAGGFVRAAYLPALSACTDHLLVMGVWSRSPGSAQSVVADIQAFSPSCKPHHGDVGLQEVLSSPDVDAVLVVLPPQAQSEVVQAALRAGKHVLSEKPAAPSLAQAEQLLAFHATLPQPAPLWCVAENYRSMDAFLRLRQAVAGGQLGQAVRLDMAADLSLTPGNKYYHSDWRRDSSTMPGAYLTEGGVHFVAALRMAAAAAGFGQAQAAVASSRGVSDDLPHPDTLQGLLWFESGAAATVSITTAAGSPCISVRAVGTAGTAEAVRGGLQTGEFAGSSRAFRLLVKGTSDAVATQVECSSNGVQEELCSFARLVRAAGRPAPGGASLTLTPNEASAAAATDGSDPEKEAAVPGAGPGPGSAAGKATSEEKPEAVPRVQEVARAGSQAIEELPGKEDALRISAVEAVRDLSVVAALLESAAGGGRRVDVAQF